jgi:hypothetical protein
MAGLQINTENLIRNYIKQQKEKNSLGFSPNMIILVRKLKTKNYDRNMCQWIAIGAKCANGRSRTGGALR